VIDFLGHIFKVGMIGVSTNQKKPKGCKAWATPFPKLCLGRMDGDALRLLAFLKTLNSSLPANHKQFIMNYFWYNKIFEDPNLFNNDT